MDSSESDEDAAAEQPRLCFCIYYSVENAGPWGTGPYKPLPNPSYFISGSIDTRIPVIACPTIDLCIVDVTNKFFPIYASCTTTVEYFTLF